MLISHLLTFVFCAAKKSLDFGGIFCWELSDAGFSSANERCGLQEHCSLCEDENTCECGHTVFATFSSVLLGPFLLQTHFGEV